MSQALGEFQDVFIQALYAHDSEGLTALTSQPGFKVYRNTVHKGVVDALLANFPTVERLVGNEWFMAAAARHARQSPPVDGRLIYHGDSFPDFLDHFEHARQLPYLGNIARLDLLWTQCHTAADQSGLDLHALSRLPADRLNSLQLKPRAAARWAWFAEQPVFTIWQQNRERRDLPEPLQWQDEGALLVRSAGVVGWHRIDAGECTFLNACAAGATFEQAACQAVAAQPSLDIIASLIRLVSADAFAAADFS